MDIEFSPRVDRESPLPVYQQIAASLTSRIMQEEWRIGEKLPSESRLMQAYSASRVTVRQALSKLEQGGFVEKQRGRGTFVTRNPGVGVLELHLPQVGRRVESDITSANIHISVEVNTSHQIGSRLGVPYGSEIVYLRRLFLRGRKVVAVNCAWFPVQRVPGMADMPLLNNSISGTLRERYGIRFASVENYIEAIILSPAEACALETASASPALKIASLYTAESGEPIEYATTIWNGLDTQFHVRIASEN